MRKYYFGLSILLLLSFFATNSNAQDSKIGVVDQHYIQQVLNNSSVEKGNLDKAQQQYYEEIEKDKKNLETKIKTAGKSDGKKLAATIDNDIVQLNEKIKVRSEEFGKRVVTYSETMQKNIKLAIQQVATEKGYTTILEVQNAPHFTQENNITNLVLAKLGVK